MRGPEGKIQDKVLAYAKSEYNALCKKNEVGRYFVSSGFPDTTIYPDRRIKSDAEVFLIEFKAPGGKLSDLQAHMKKKIEAQGYRVYVIDSAEHGKKIIDKECGK